MSITIARLFETRAEAANAVIELERAAVPDSDISVVSLSANDGRKDGSCCAPHYGAKGLGASTVAETLVRFLISAGASKDEAEAYAEGVNRGGTLVSVKVADANLLSAQAAMKVDPDIVVSRGASVRQSVWTSCAGEGGGPRDGQTPLTEEDVEEERRLRPSPPTK